VLEDLQRRDQLALGKGGAAPFVGEGGQRADHRLVAHDLAETALKAPDGDQGFAIDAVACLDAVQGCGVLVQQALSAADPLGRNRAFQILPDRARELRLAAIGFDHRRIGLHPGEGAVEGGGGNTRCQGFCTELLAPLAEAEMRGFCWRVDDGIVATLTGGGGRVADKRRLREGFGGTGDHQAHRRGSDQRSQQQNGNEGVIHAPLSKGVVGR